MITPIDKQSFGQNGCLFVKNGFTTAITGQFCAMQALTDVILSALTMGEATLTSGATISNFTFPAGFIFYGEITGLTFSSGAAILYNAA